ncbi:MAG: hypothetical protein E3J21_10855 [Anaerolineales bacterium]|nr:MAG: hypothetical protein E3J21_10855 [Anaerolineales bacterium]
MPNERRASFHRIAVVLATFLVAACVMATGACAPQRLPEETPVPSPTSTMKPPPPTPTPIPTPTPSCALEPVGEFREAWNLEDLGCPEDEEKVIWCAWQEFEHGYMLWRIDNRKIYAFSLEGADGGSWQEYDDTWADGKYPIDIDPSIVPPSEDMKQPKRGFGLVWREQLGGPESDIGWARMEETGLCAVIQPFEKGVMFRYNAEEHSDDVVEECRLSLLPDDLILTVYRPLEDTRVAMILYYADNSWHSYK